MTDRITQQDIERSSTLDASDLGREYTMVNGTYQFLKSDDDRKIEIRTFIHVTDEDVSDILVTAFEGGINHWCRKVTCYEKYEGYASDQLAKGHTLYLMDAYEPEEYQLTMHKFMKGLTKFLENNPSVIFDGAIDCANIDAGGADEIIQYALFDEMQFG